MSIILTSITSSTSENSISIITKPTKLNYKENDTLDLTGLAVKFYQKDKQPIDINSFTTEPANGANLTRNDNIITVKYSKDGALYIAYLPINVKYPTALEVAYLPKTSYREGDTVDTTGLKMMLVYNDNSKELIDSGITSTPAHGAPIGNAKFIEFSGNINGYILKTIKNITVASSSGDLGLDATREYVRKKLCTWAGGSWSEIYEMVKLSKDNVINLKDYWKVGDEKVVWRRKDTNIDNADAKKYNKTSKFNPEVQMKFVIIEITKDFRKDFVEDKNAYFGEVVFTPKTYYPNNIFDLPVYRIVNNTYHDIFKNNDNLYNYDYGVFCAQSISGGNSSFSLSFDSGDNIINFLYGKFSEYQYMYNDLDFYTDIDTNFYKIGSDDHPGIHKRSKMVDGLLRSRILLKHIYTDGRKISTTATYKGLINGPATQYTGYQIFKNCTLKVTKSSETGKIPKAYLRYSLSSLLYESEVSGPEALSYYRVASNRIIEAYKIDGTKGWPDEPRNRTLGVLLADLPSENFDGINYNQDKVFSNIDFHAYTSDNGMPSKSKLVFNGETPKICLKYINRNGEVATINPFINEHIYGVKLAANPVFVI